MRPGTGAGAGPAGVVTVTGAAAAGLAGTEFGSVGVGDTPVGLGVRFGAGGQIALFIHIHKLFHSVTQTL